MRRKIKRLWIEGIIVVTLLICLTAYMIPKFFAMQNINRPDCIPDPSFRKHLEYMFGVESGGHISKAQIAKVKELDFNSYGSAAIYTTQRPAGITIEELLKNAKQISDLTGIHYFQNLIHLNTDGNIVKKLDISKNRKLQVLSCNGNRLRQLDVSKNHALIELHCQGNDLTALDTSALPNLQTLDCSSNKLIHIDVSLNPKLKRLLCRGNYLQSIDLSNNLLLERLDISYNQFRDMPDLRKHKHLVALTVEYNYLGVDDLPLIGILKNRFHGEWTILRDNVYKGFLYADQKNYNLDEIADKTTQK